MTLYHVTWAIDLDADSPRTAAERALDIQRDAGSIATVFDVTEFNSDGTLSGLTMRVDLLGTEDEDYPEFSDGSRAPVDYINPPEGKCTS